MKLLRCIICRGEVDIIDDSTTVKKIKCKSCGFSNGEVSANKAPEILVIRKRISE